MFDDEIVEVEDFNIEHPLRSFWSDEDWDRIKSAMLGDSDLDTISMDEIKAVEDLVYDNIAAKKKTHESVNAIQ